MPFPKSLTRACSGANPTMGFLYGFIGAILGAIVGGATTLLIVSAAMDGDDLGIFFAMQIFGLVGLIVGAILGIVASLCLLRYVKRHQEGSNARRRSALIVSGSILAVPVSVATMAWGIVRSGQPPSDQNLLNNFTDHRTVFNQLAQMKLADSGLMQIHSDWTQPSEPQTVGVSSERVAKYREMLSQAEVHFGLEADGLHGADFLCWEHGSATSSDTDKGYAYLTVPPKRVLSSLDQYNHQYQSEGLSELRVYRHIEGCWYLYYEYLPG